MAIALPVAPHALLLLAKTGNPVFPYFNELFASPYYPRVDIKDGRWGPSSAVEALGWPLLSAFRPERLSEFAATTGRLALGWLAALAALVAFRKDSAPPRDLGDRRHRRAPLEPRDRLSPLRPLPRAPRRAPDRARRREARWSGLCRRRVRAGLRLRRSRRASPRPSFSSRRGAVRAERRARRSARTGAAGPPSSIAPGAAARDALHLLRDRDLRAFLSPEERKAIPVNPVWVDAGPKSNGIMSLLDRDAPMIGLQVEVCSRLR